MTVGEVPWQIVSHGLRVRVRVTPKASRVSIDGLAATGEGPALKVRVRDVPEDGAANQAVIRAVAEWLEVPVRSVALVAGGKSRVKMLEVSGDGRRLAVAATGKLPGGHTRERNWKG